MPTKSRHGLVVTIPGQLPPIWSRCCADSILPHWWVNYPCRQQSAIANADSIPLNLNSTRGFQCLMLPQHLVNNNGIEKSRGEGELSYFKATLKLR